MTGCKGETPSSESSQTSQVTSAAACDIALYSASAELLETVGCLLDFQLMGEVPNKIIQPVTDLLEKGQDAQSL